jgi:hypothetical protein
MIKGEEREIQYYTVISILIPEPVFLNVYGAPELIPRNEFHQPM